MKKLGVIVGRFQTDYIHEAHQKLIELVLSENDNVLIVIGCSPAILSYHNPLPFEARKEMILSAFNSDKIIVEKLTDHKSDQQWSINLDQIINNHIEGQKCEVSLYTGRDGFSKYYNGSFHVKIVSFGLDLLSASDIRNQIHSVICDDKSWRAGLIFASNYRYPVSYQTVDIAVINFDKMELLLGKKPGEKNFRFVGGHVDVTDESLEMAAKRETVEECGDIETDNYKYIGSYRIDDWRHRIEKDKILTAFFCCNYIYGLAVASDDISEVQWFPLHKVTTDMIEIEHVCLFDALIKYLQIKFVTP